MANEQPPQEQSPPSKVARLSLDSGAVAAAATPVDFGAGDKKPFTFMQLQEMKQQALIYNYLAAGVPVPLHLVLPIWKSFAIAAARNPHLYPTLMEWGNLCWEYRHNMEAEPGRCRRTDGKKWRCLRNVLPEQKYCEHHLHRGRNRSRKPVETGGGRGLISTADTAASNVDTTMVNINDP